MSDESRPTREVTAVLVAKAVRTLAYGFLGIVLPVYLARLGMPPTGVGAAVALTLVGSAALTWAVRRPAERLGARAALLALAALSGLAGVLLLATREPWLVVLAAMLGNVAVGSGETGPFLAVEQVVVARAVTARRRTAALSVYNLVGYGAAAAGAGLVTLVAEPQRLFALFLAASGVQALAYLALPDTPAARRAPAPRATSAAVRRLAALFALDAFAGGFVLQSLIAYYLHVRYALALPTLGAVFLVSQVLTAASLLLAAPLTRRLGLLDTMVFSHLVSNVALMAIAGAPTAGAAVALLFARQLFSQIDVPTRQAYVMGIVEDREREAAAATTTLWRTVAQAVTPTLTGWIMQAGALAAPFVVGGGLKIVYDLTLYALFRRVKPRPEPE